MPTERIKKQIGSLLSDADSATARNDWATVKQRAEAALALDPANEDAKAYLAAALRTQTASLPSQRSSGGQPVHTPATSEQSPLEIARRRKRRARSVEAQQKEQESVEPDAVPGREGQAGTVSATPRVWTPEVAEWLIFVVSAAIVAFVVHDFWPRIAWVGGVVLFEYAVLKGVYKKKLKLSESGNVKSSAPVGMVVLLGLAGLVLGVLGEVFDWSYPWQSEMTSSPSGSNADSSSTAATLFSGDPQSLLVALGSMPETGWYGDANSPAEVGALRAARFDYANATPPARTSWLSVFVFSTSGEAESFFEQQQANFPIAQGWSPGETKLGSRAFMASIDVGFAAQQELLAVRNNVVIECFFQRAGIDTTRFDGRLFVERTDQALIRALTR